MGLKNEDEDTFTFDGAAGGDNNGTKQTSTADDGPEIEVIEDTPPQDRGRQPLDKDVPDPTDDELEQYSQGVKKRMGELTHARHDERRRREAAEREAAEALRVANELLAQNRELQTRFNEGAKEYVSVSKKAAEAAVEAARKQLRDAKESYDTDAELAAQEALLEAKLQLRRVDEMRVPVAETQQPVVQTAQPTSQVDQKTLDWQAKNQWFGRDEEMTSVALAVHSRLTKTGYDPRSDEYFAAVNKRMREVFPDRFEDEQREESTKPPARSATVVAPATRSSGGKQRVQLTKTQLALAAKLKLTPQQYAAELIKLEQKNG